MRTKLFTLAFLLSFLTGAFAQDRTTVNAYSSDISDNLDLRAVASIFGDSEDLADFERRLNDPKIQISNLDLNNDNQVDYLRVIETVEGNTHLIIIQAILGRDLFQDVATVEVERDNRNNVQVQVVGDVYMYGSNYIYEPVYVHTPVMYNHFWANHYRPYYSSWYWGYYPSYYYAWNPYPVYSYQNNVHVHINNSHYYNYVNTRRSTRAIALHNTRRSNAYEVQNPHRSFTQRTSLTNRYEIDRTRIATTAASNVRPTTTRSTSGTRSETASPTTRIQSGTTRSTTVSPTRSAPQPTTRAQAPSSSTRAASATRSTSRVGSEASAPRQSSSTRSTSLSGNRNESTAPATRYTAPTGTRYQSSSSSINSAIRSTPSGRSQAALQSRTFTQPSAATRQSSGSSLRAMPANGSSRR
ncbi:MAG TPA: hypothetical protein VFQ50_07840 [Flavobacterium sp.]|nr:hypothetical protein [Flavobacterium sp.]